MLTICCLGYCDDSQWALTRRRDAQWIAKCATTGSWAGRPLALSAQSASRSLSFVKTRWDILSQRHAMPCQRHGLLRASFFLAVAEL